MIEFLVEQSAELVGPDALASLEWVTKAFGCTPATLVGTMWQLKPEALDASAVLELAERILTAVSAELRDRVQPFLDGLPNGDLKDLVTFVAPLLDVVEIA